MNLKPFLFAAVLITAVFCAVGTLAQNIPLQGASTDISFLAASQVDNLAQLNSKKVEKLKSGQDATKETSDLNAALQKYNIPASVQSQLDKINSQGLPWTANYNNIFIKTDAEKKQILGLKPDNKILELTGQKIAVKTEKNNSFSFSKFLAGIFGYFQNFNPARMLAGILGPISPNGGIPAVCGTANKAYLATDTGFGSDTFCAAGTLSGTAPQFPVQGGLASWVCIGVNGGKGSVCSASRAADNFGDETLPDNFDWRNVNGQNYVTSVKDQGQCGDCWAFGATATLEGNIQTYYNDPSINPDLSEQDLTSCDANANGCGGAYAYQIQDIFQNYYVNTGLSRESCFPFVSGATGNTGSCNKCDNWATKIWKTNSSSQTVITIVDPYASPLSDLSQNINAIKAALINYGPVEVGMAVYNDFPGYSSGIYMHSKGSYIEGYHAVTIVGYGFENDTPYWIVKNSWNASWGNAGYFKIAMSDSYISQWFAFVPGTPTDVASVHAKKCVDADGDKYCNWGTGPKPATGCPASCVGNNIEDCNDSDASIYTNCGQLPYDTGALQIYSTPAGASVYAQNLADGKWNQLGYTPGTFMMQAGSRTIKLSLADHYDDIENVSITKDNILTLNVNLKLSPKITNPQNNDIYRAGDILNIVGTTGELPFTSYRIEWSIDQNTWSTQGITLANGGTQQVVNGTLAQWDTSFITLPNFYYLRMTGINGYVPLVQEIYFDPTLAAGWPQRINDSVSTFCPFGSTNYSAVTTAKYSIMPSQDSNGNTKISVFENTDRNAFGFYKVNYNLTGSQISSSSSTCYYSLGFLEPIAADLKGDGKKEVITFVGGSFTDVPMLYAYNSDGSLFWKESVPGDPGAEYFNGNLTMPIVGDINGDGRNEIIVFQPNIYNSDYQTSILYAFNGDGTILWKNYVPADWNPTMLMADLNNDGHKEIVIKGNNMSPNPVMTVVDSTGKVIYSWNLPAMNWYKLLAPMPAPAVGHFDSAHPDKLQIVFDAVAPDAGYDQNSGKWINHTIVNVFNEDGSELPGWPVILPGGIPTSPVVGDINGDGKDEIVLGLLYASQTPYDTNYGGFYALDGGGNILPGWPANKGWIVWSAPALGDVDGDGKLEIADDAMDNQGPNKDFLMRFDGTSMPGWPQYVNAGVYSFEMGDINGDGKTDILKAYGNGFAPWIGNGGVYAWNSNGTMISGLPKLTEENADAPVTIADLNGDGKTELVESSDGDADFINHSGKGRGSLYVWNTNQPYVQANMPWPMYMHDTMHTGCYDCGPKYIINASVDPTQTGGTISPSGDVAVDSGGSKAFTITPNAGYQISHVEVDGQAVMGMQPVGQTQTYTVSGITAIRNVTHTIVASFLQPPGTFGCTQNSDCPSGICQGGVCCIKGSGIFHGPICPVGGCVPNWQCSSICDQVSVPVDLNSCNQPFNGQIACPTFIKRCGIDNRGPLPVVTPPASGGGPVSSACTPNWQCSTDCGQASTPVDLNNCGTSQPDSMACPTLIRPCGRGPLPAIIGPTSLRKINQLAASISSAIDSVIAQGIKILLGR